MILLDIFYYIFPLFLYLFPFLFLGVKPQGMRELLASLSDVLGARNDRFVLVTMAAGLTVKTIREMAGGDYPVIRIMPNTPAAVGEGVILA